MTDKTIYRRASAEEMMEAGYDPKWFLVARHDGSVDNDDLPEGPYWVYLDNNGLCPCCHSKAQMWTIVDVSAASGFGRDWDGDGGRAEAEELAAALNRAWQEGYQAAKAEPQP